MDKFLSLIREENLFTVPTPNAAWRVLAELKALDESLVPDALAILRGKMREIGAARSMVCVKPDRQMQPVAYDLGQKTWSGVASHTLFDFLMGTLSGDRVIRLLCDTEIGLVVELERITREDLLNDPDLWALWGVDSAEDLTKTLRHIRMNSSLSELFSEVRKRCDSYFMKRWGVVLDVSPMEKERDEFW